MNRVPNLNPLDVARKIDSFTYKSLATISDDIKGAPLSVRVRIAEGLSEFIGGVLLQSGFWESAESGSADWQRIESLIVEFMMPELTGSSASLKESLSDEGGDLLRGYSLEMPTKLSLVA